MQIPSSSPTTGATVDPHAAKMHVALNVSGMSTDLKQKLAMGAIDIALVKREPDSGPSWAAWPQVLLWVKGAGVDSAQGVLPLALFPQGCIYRQRAIRLLDVAQRPRRIALAATV